MGQRDGSPETEVHSITGLLQEARKILNKQSNSTPKTPSKTTTNKAQTEWKEGNNQDQRENNQHQSENK